MPRQEALTIPDLANSYLAKNALSWKEISNHGDYKERDVS